MNVGREEGEANGRERFGGRVDGGGRWNGWRRGWRRTVGGVGRS